MEEHYRQGCRPKCNICGISFTREDHSSTHNEKMTRIQRSETEQIKCSLYSFSSPVRTEVVNHFYSHVNKMECFDCKYCEYATASSTSFKLHVRTHTGDKPHKCNLCQYESARIGNLSKHMKSHTGEKPYKCNECEYASSHKCDLKVHIRIHTGEKPYQCEQCEKSFISKGPLKRHIRIHTSEKPFQCKQCEKSFRRGSHLKRHIQTHTGEKPFKCNQCGYYASTQKVNLKKHAKFCGENKLLEVNK